MRDPTNTARGRDARSAILPLRALPRSGRYLNQQQTQRFGAHMSIAGGYWRAVAAASAAGMGRVQLFTKNNNQWRAKPIVDSDISDFRTALAKAQITSPISHASYLINLASPDEELWRKSVDAMVVEVERAAALGIGDVVVHPGAHMGSGEAAGLKRVVRAVDQVIRRTAGTDVVIDIESTAGQGSCLGHRFEHLAHVARRVRVPERVGVCLDSCHLFAAGYAMSNTEQYDAMIDQLEATVGVARVRVWHLNDSCKSCGSRVDRHAGIGRGVMGLEPFRFIVNDSRFAQVPMILETPKGLEDGIDLDVINMRVLAGLIRRQKAARVVRASGAQRS